MVDGGRGDERGAGLYLGSLVEHETWKAEASVYMLSPMT